MEVISKITTALTSTKASARPGDKLSSALKKAGMEVLGHGAFAAVAKIEGKVFKVYNKSDYAYNAFVSFIQNKRTVLVPQVSVISREVGSEGWIIVEIEELIKLQSPEVLDYLGINDSHVSDLTTYIKNYTNRRMAARPEPGGWHDYVAKCPAWAHRIVNMKNLKGFLEKMMDYARDQSDEIGYVNWDIHMNNVMIRKTGIDTQPYQLVLTDPWSEY